MCIFYHMDYIHNLYPDYAQLAQIGSKIFLTGSKKKCIIYDQEEDKVEVVEFKLGKDTRNLLPRAFQLAVHHKDIGKVSQVAETIYQFNYYQPLLQGAPQ